MAERNDPYPFPSDIHVTSSVTLKLSDTNYLLWKTQIEALLRSQKLLGFPTGLTPAPAATVVNIVNDAPVEAPNPAHEAWTCTDELVKSWIFGTLTEEVLGLVHALATSQVVWLALASHYNKSSLAREFELRRRLQLLSVKGKTFLVYCREFRILCDNLSAIGKPVDENMKIFTFLNGLGREYDPITTVIQSSLSRLPPQTFNDVVLEISAFDAKLQSYEATPEVSPHLAFQTQRFGNSNYGGNRGRGGSFGRSGNYRGRGGYSTRGRGFTQQVNTSGWNQPPGSQSQGSQSGNTRPVCQICGRVGHVALKCWNRFDNAYQSNDTPHALAALQVSDSSGREWLADSGATAHMTPSATNLQNSVPYNGQETVMVADGTYLPITHVGSTTLNTTTGSLPLCDILVCPSMQKSLLSVSKLCDDFPCGVYFDANAVSVIDLNTQKVVTRGQRREKLYVLEQPDFVAFYSNRQTVAGDLVWHQRLGHANPQVLQLLKTSKAISVNKSSTTSVCEPCQMGKSSQLPFFDSVSSVMEPLDRIHCDLWGPSPVVSVQGFKYYAVFVDNYSRYSWIFPLKMKSDFCDIFIGFQKQIENQLSKKIKVFQSDGGGEFMSTRFRAHLQNHGIQHLISCPSTPQQNGISERKHRHLTELGLSMMFQSKVPLRFWVEAFYSANFITNMLPSPSLKNKSPSELILKKVPDYSFLRVFGSACYPCLRPFTQHKFEPRSLQCVFLGYHPQYKGYRCLYPPTGRVYINRHVIFDETCFPFMDKYKHLVSQQTTGIMGAWQAADPPQRQVLPTLSSLRSQVLSPTHASHENVVEYPLEDNTTETSPADIGLQTPDREEMVLRPSPETNTQQAVEPVTEEQRHPMRTRLQSGIRKPNPRYALLASTTIPSLPKTVAEALTHPGWRQAMLEELQSIFQNHTWSLVPPEASMNVLGCRWVFTVKLNADGTLQKLKARLVAKGFNQEEGIDFNETYSPVVRTSTIRIVLTVATAKQWNITQLDVKNAFLHGDLQEQVYMVQPPGFEDHAHPTHVCSLHKALYGLKQAPRAWFDKFSNFLIEYGFVCSKADPSLFVYRHNGDTLVLLLYVDDILLTGSNPALFKSLINELSARFAMKDLGTFHYFLGVQAQHHSDGLFIHQAKYTEEILHSAGMSTCNPINTPLPLRLDHVFQDTTPFAQPFYFRSLAGKLQYLTITRPDIQYAVNFVCQRMHSPTEADFGLLKRILRYLRGTSTMGLYLSKHSSLDVVSYSDSDWAGCRDTRRSTTGFSVLLGSNVISWSAKRQPTVSRSSTEAEYRALATTASELTWVSSVLRDLLVPQTRPAVLRCDNLSAVQLSANPVFHNRSKHFDTDYHYVRERVALGVLEVQHVPSHLQLADIFTKSLPRQSFQQLRHKLKV